MKKEIAVFGGAYDPPHLGHLAVAKAVYQQLKIPVWMTPAAYHPFGKKMTVHEHRINMLDLMTRDVEGVEVCGIEIYNYSGLTADLSKLLRDRHPDTNFRIIMGEDNAQIIKSKWIGYERIIEHHPLIIVPRKGYPAKHDWYHEPPHVVVPWDEVEVSSSMIRGLFKERKSEIAARYLHPDVVTYICENSLYYDN